MDKAGNLAKISRMIHMTTCAAMVGLTIACFSPLGRSQEKVESASSTSSQVVDPNKDAYHRASRAAAAKTFAGAVLLIEQIDLKPISDTDVADYVAISLKLAKFCDEMGIPRDAGTDYLGVIKNLDYTAVLKVLMSKGVSGAPGKAAELLSEGRKLKNALPTYEKLDAILQDRYGQP